MKKKEKGVKPRKFRDEFVKQAFELALLGCTNKDMAHVFNVDLQTIDYWMRTKKKFRDKVNQGKLKADAKVAAALFKRAVGFSVMEDHISVFQGEVIVTPTKKHYPPESWAAMKWLGLRQRALWAEIQKIESTHTNVNITKFDFSQLSTEELALAKKLGIQQMQKELTAHMTEN